MAMSAKKLSEAGVSKVYKQAFKEQYRLDEILSGSHVYIVGRPS